MGDKNGNKSENRDLPGNFDEVKKKVNKKKII